MSLELAITENTKAIHALIEAIKTIPSATVELRAEPAAAGKPLTAAEAQEALFNQHGKAEAAKLAEPKAESKPAEPKAEATKPAAAKAAEPKAESKPAAPAPAADAPTFEQVRDAILALSKSKGREPVVVLLQRFGANKVPDLRPEFFAEALALVRRAEAGEDIAAATE